MTRYCTISYRHYSSAVKEKKITKIDGLYSRSVLGPSNLPLIYCVFKRKKNEEETKQKNKK